MPRISATPERSGATSPGGSATTDLAEDLTSEVFVVAWRSRRCRAARPAPRPDLVARMKDRRPEYVPVS